MLKGLVASFDAKEHESSCTAQRTDRFIDDKQKSISDCTVQLLELREQQRKLQQQELEDQRMGIHHCLSVLARRAEQARTSSYENFHCESAGLQICASVSGQSVTAKDLSLSRLMALNYVVTFLAQRLRRLLTSTPSPNAKIPQFGAGDLVCFLERTLSASTLGESEGGSKLSMMVLH